MPRMGSRLASLVLAGAVLAGATGCATTRIIREWRDPGYAAPGFARIVVIGVSHEAAIRRTFEDAFVARLREAGVAAEPSYRYIPESGQVAESRLQEAVRRAGADAAIVTRLVRVETHTRLSPGIYSPPPLLGIGFYHGYSAAWLGFYDPPRVYQYDVYISETSLYDTGQDRMVWTGTVRTVEPHDLTDEIERYVGVVVETLQDRGLLTPRRPARTCDPAAPPSAGS